MYMADTIVSERFGSPMQTKANNNDPTPLVYVMRNKTAIHSQKFWEKQRITPDVGTRSSIAVKRPEGSFLGDEIFTAQVESGTAVIRRSYPRNNIMDMEWTTMATISDVSELSIMFDGYMKQSADGTVESYTIGELPYVFFVDSSGSLKMRNMDDVGSGDITVSDNAVNVASVRGLYADAIDLDDGILLYYTNSSGQLWEAIILNGEVSELTQITLKPTGVTSWLDIWAGRSFDYRVMLQLKGDDDKVYTLISKSRTSGYSLLEHINISVSMSAKFGEEIPLLLSVKNEGV